MKIHKISEKDKEVFIYLIKRNLINSVIFGLPDIFIKKYFFKEIINSKKYISLICKFKKKPAGIIIIKKKNCYFSFTLQFLTIFYCLISFFLKDINILFKFYYIFFKRVNIKKKYNNIFNVSAEIIYVCVDKKFRKKGIGSELIIHSLKKINKKHNFLITSSENSKEAIRFYEKNNFRKIGTEKRFKKNNILLIKKLKFFN